MNRPTETTVLHRVMLAVTAVGARLFRNQSGRCWQGKSVVVEKDGYYPCGKGDVILHNPRSLKTGLTNGASDLIGWTSKTVTPEMLGTRIAVFTALEVKNPQGSVVTDEQYQFGAAVKDAGGIFAIVDDPVKAADAVVLFRTSGIRA